MMDSLRWRQTGSLANFDSYVRQFAPMDMQIWQGCFSAVDSAHSNVFVLNMSGTYPAGVYVCIEKATFSARALRKD